MKDVMKLYKYISNDTLYTHLDSILRGEVYLSRWNDLNDPMEGFFIYSANNNPRQHIDNVIGEKSEYRVSCFSKSYKKFLLWSHYSFKHRGVCLEFEVAKKDLPQNCFLEPIQYSKILPEFRIDEDINLQARRFLSTKLIAWKQEGEVRLLCRSPQQHTMPFGRLTGIIFGINYHKDDKHDQNRQKLINTIRHSCNDKPCLYQANIERESAEIHRKKFTRYDNQLLVEN